MAEDDAAIAAPPASVDDPGKPAASNSMRDAGSDSPGKQQRKRGIVSRLWRGMFGADDDFEKMLQHLSKAEASVQARLKRRALSSRKMARNVIALSVALEVAAVSYAIMMTRAVDLSWQMRALRVLPMFVLPGLSAAVYSVLVSLTRTFDSKDQKTLERLRAERQAKIDELKERTHFYTTQQLIQKYDLDPAAKAAAATILASKIGSDSGLKVYVGGESSVNESSGKSYDVELVQSSGLRSRRTAHTRGHPTGNYTASQFIDETSNEYGVNGEETDSSSHRVLEHHGGSHPNDGGWLARIAALLVGEDPTQCYALICRNCHMHNGLARKEDFEYITYYCPHCHVLNGSRQSEEHEIGSASVKESPLSPLNGNDSYHDENNTSSVTKSAAEVHELPGRSAEEEHDDVAS